MVEVVVVVGAIFFYLFRKPLYLITFDEETAKTNGVPVKAMTLSFSIVTGMIVASAMPIVGVLLVSALIILPAALAIRIAPSFRMAIALAMIFGFSGVCSGLTASYHVQYASGRHDRNDVAIVSDRRHRDQEIRL